MKFLWLLLLVVPTQLYAQAPPSRIPGAVWVDPDHAQVFRVDWRNVKTCTGLERDFDDIVWFVVPGGSFRDPVQEERGEQRTRYWGEWVRPDTIYIAEVRPEWVVRHELIHYFRDRIDHDEKMNHQCQAP